MLVADRSDTISKPLATAHDLSENESRICGLRATRQLDGRRVIDLPLATITKPLFTLWSTFAAEQEQGCSRVGIAGAGM